ncbi:transposase [Myroides albus]|uniref:transposase n=1 Tax=Myroides albus TaxID=2562892 RepID=UPI001E2849F0|nr:transposase [Myroides albus]
MYNYKMTYQQRESIRLKGYDYAPEGLYFITLCVQDRENIFGSIKDGVLTLNEIGEIARDEWLNIANVRDNVILHEFIIMPNHIHAIIEIVKNKAKAGDNKGFKSPSQTIGAIVRGYKIATIKRIKAGTNCNSFCVGELPFAPTPPTGRTIWQRNYYEHIIRDERSYQYISNYIITNPERWHDDKFHR